MKISVTSSYAANSLYGNSVAHGREKEADIEKQYEVVEENNNKKRPVPVARPNGSEHFTDSINGARINGLKKTNQPSFTGSSAEMITNVAKEAILNNSNIPAWAEKMGGANWFKKVLHSVDKSEAFFEAFIALFVAGIMKPACVLAMPGAEKEDKEMAATKNSVSAILGFGLSNLILSPCSTAVNKITDSLNSDEPLKYIKDAEYVKALKNENVLDGMKSTLGESFKTTYKKIWDLGVSPMKAGLTIALTPVILKLIFGKDKKSKKAEVKQEIPLQNSTVFSAIRAERNIKGVNKTETQPTQPIFVNSAPMPAFAGNSLSFTGNSPSFTGNSPSFTGGKIDPVIQIVEEETKKMGAFSKVKEAYCQTLGEFLAKFMGKISQTKVARKIVEGTAHFEKPSPMWSDLASVAITFFYIKNTYKSEKIEPERKLPLMINNVMVTAASSLAAFLIDKYTDKPMEELLRGYLKEHDAELFNKSNRQIVKALTAALEEHKTGGNVTVEKLKRHSAKLLPEDMSKISETMKEAIKALENNDIIKKALKEGLIEQSDIAKMCASRFESNADKIFKNISKAKSLTIFTITVRFLVTVLMTPVIGRVVAIVNKKLGKDKQNQKTESVKLQEIKNPETFGIKDFMGIVKG